MSYQQAHEEQWECCATECDNIGDRVVRNPITGQGITVCSDHYSELLDRLEEDCSWLG